MIIRATTHWFETPRSGGRRSAPVLGRSSLKFGRGLKSCEACGLARSAAAGDGRTPAAFTLIEMLVVIAIVGLLASIGLIGIRGMTKSNATIAANRQLLDDLSYARQRAIADHTTVYMVFVPPSIADPNGYQPPPATDPAGQRMFYNLLGGQYTTYALLSMRQIGEQPGNATPRYLSEWRSLPTGTFIATNKFDINDPGNPNGTFNFPGFVVTVFPVASVFPYPYVSSNLMTASLPYVGFDYLGRLTTGRDENIPLAHGSIFYARDANGNFIQAPADVQETPPNNSVLNYNVIHIDWLTGRARIMRQEVQ